MNWLDILKSLILVVAGAGITIVSELVRGILGRSKEREQRSLEHAEVRRVEGRKHAEEVLRLLNLLWSDILAFAPKDGEFKVLDREVMRAIYGTYLLIPDETVRKLLTQGLWGVNNPQVLDEFDLETDGIYVRARPEQVQLSLTFAMRNALAAYLRGDPPESRDVKVLSEIEAFLTERYGLQ